MKQKLLNSIRLRIALLVALLCSLGTGSVWADTTGTINFGSASGSTKIEGSTSSGSGTVTYTDTGSDSQGNTWTITTITSNAKSFTQNASYSQVGASSKPVTSITLTTTLSEDVNIKSLSAKFGGFSGTAGTVTLKVGDTTVGSGSLNATSDVTVSSSSAQIGKVLTITVTSISKGFKVYNVNYTYAPATVPITSIAFDKSEATVEVGGTVTITPTISPTGYTETPVWESDNTGIATVSNGVVTGVAEGTAFITLTSPTDDSIYDICEVTVNAAKHVTGVSLDETSKALHPGDEFDLTATVSPNDATNKAVTWTSSNDALATVDNGHVTAIAAGTPTITVTTVDGSFTATCNLNITNVAVTGVTLDESNAIIYTGSLENTVQLTATVAPSNATNKAVTWTSSNTSVATVSSTGLVTSVAAGSTTITATTTDGSYTATCDITVENGPGTAENPYTVAEARTKIDSGSDLNSKYVHGIISQVDSYNSTYKSITYWISDDGTTTNQFEVYGGLKSYNNESGSFSAKDDLQVGDVVTVFGNLKKFSSTYELDKDNYLVSFFRKDDSDLSITSSTSVNLERTSAQASPTSTITWTTSSTGTVTCVSSNTSVATVTNAGVITAVGEGEATITITQATDASYKEGSETVTVYVTDNRSACATGIDLTSAKTITKNASAAISATSTKADGFTGEITYSYSSANSSIFSIVDGNYSGAGVGATTVTVTATPTGGNADNYKAASQEVAVTVNGTNSISLDMASKTQVYSDGDFTLTATVPTENYNGTVTASSNNEDVATVSVDGTTVTVNPKAVGSATITVTAGTGTYYPATAQATCAVTVTAPAGNTTAPSSDVTETFDFSENGWGLPTKSGTLSGDYTKGTQTVTISGTGYYYGSKALLIGKSGAYITLPEFDKPVSQIDVVGVSGASGSVKQNIFVESAAVSTETTGANGVTNKYKIASENQDAGTIYTLKVTNAYNTQVESIIVHMCQAPTATVSLNASGYATYCSVNPMDYSEAEGYTAWYIESITKEGVITFNKITGTIKGGQGVLLYDKNATAKKNVTVKFADSSNELSGNKLVGTTAPTYVEAGAVYGLKGSDFVVSSANGVIPANRAYISASSIPAGVKSFTFVFEDITTGITETRTATREEVEAIFNLNGQRMSKMQRGINIVNGKKVLVK